MAETNNTYSQNQSSKSEPSDSKTTTKDTTKNAQPAAGELLGKQATLFPIISINGQKFGHEEIKLVEINTSGFLPTCEIVIEIKDGGTSPFFPKYFPKDNDVVNVFFRSLNDKLKPIRNDYLIKHINTTTTQNITDNVKIFISGVFFVPNLFSDNSIAIPEANSLEALTSLADSLGLGFTTNESIESMKDTMTWINPQNTFYEFIQHITKHAYKDADSFFDCWIDVWGQLNFINLHKIYDSVETDYLDDIKTEYKLAEHTDDIPNITFGGDNITLPTTTVLTNDVKYKETEGYFAGFGLENTSSELNIINGMGRNIYFYDKNLRSKIEMFIKSSNTEGLENVPKHTKLTNDNYKDSYKTKWMGFQYSKPTLNVHNYYKISEIQNIQNISSVSKLNLVLKMKKMNYSIYKGMKVPVVIKYDTQSDTKAALKGNTGVLKTKGTDKASSTNDEFFSGAYVIDSITYKYTYNGTGERQEFGTFIQEVKLLRREWGKYSIDLSKPDDMELFYPKEEMKEDARRMTLGKPVRKAR